MNEESMVSNKTSDGQPVGLLEHEKEPEEILKKTKKRRKRSIQDGNGRGVQLQPRDIAWFKYLAWGPGRLAEATKFYLKKGELNPIPSQLIYRRLIQLTKAGFLQRRFYGSLQKSICYYLGEVGVQVLTGYGYEPDHIRNKIVSEVHIAHELILAGVARKIFTDSYEGKLYKVLSVFDDRMLKYRSKFKKGMVYPDLRVRIQPFNGPAQDYAFEIEGIELRRHLFIKKLQGLAETTNILFVIVREQARIEALYRYAEIAPKKPKHIFFGLFYPFLDYGILKLPWDEYPTKKKRVLYLS